MSKVGMRALGLVAAALLGMANIQVANAATPNPNTLLGVTMSVTGRITDTVTGQGIAGMCVNATWDQGTQSATSASDGSYAVTWKQAARTTPETVSIVATAYCGANGWWQSTPDSPRNVTVTPQAGHSSASGVDLQAAPAGRIVGKITDDNTGQPVSGVTVDWWQPQGWSSPRSSVTQVTTQSDGSYLIGGLATGTYAVVIDRTTHVGRAETPTRSLIGYLPDYVHHVSEGAASAGTALEQVSVTVGQDTTVDESIYPADAVTGTVTDSATGLPLPNVTVEAWGGSDWNEVGAYTEGYTDALGRYRVDGLGPGTYRLCFEPDLTTPVLSSYQSACWKNQPDRPWEQTGTPIVIDGFGTVTTGIDQGLTRST